MPDDNDIAHEVLRTIRQIVRSVGAHSQHLSREVGLTVPQLLCLKAVGDAEDELTVTEVADRVQLSAATVSRIVDRLERGGLVVRTRRAPDRRRVLLSLTEEGAARYDALPTPLQERFVARLGELPAAERRRLLQALQQICGLMDASDLDAAPVLAPELELQGE